MITIEFYAPGVIKLLGEHAVVYGKLSIALGINQYAKASIKESDKFEISLPDITSKKFLFSANELNALYDSYASRESLADFCAAYSSLQEFLPYAIIAASALRKYGIDIKKSIVVTSSIPFKKGFASSAACSTSFAAALLHSITLSDREFIEIAREGEKIIHKNDNAGKIDISTSYMGGIVCYSDAEGIRKVNAKLVANIIAIDTGPKKSTAETVGLVARKYKENPIYTSSILDKIDACSRKGLESLIKGDMVELGKLMLEDHNLLVELGVSSEGIDKAVKIAMENGAYGAKLSGGGGGGMAIVLSSSDDVCRALKDAGFEFYKLGIDYGGAKAYLS
ncbi:MAG: mevalonate kinase [Candidatus Micrarchaeaceae archaeon]